MSCLHILEINPWLAASIAIIFSHSEDCLLVFIAPFAMQKLLSLIRSHLFIFGFISITLGGRSKRLLLQFMFRVFCLCFPLGVLQFLILHVSL